ncbi:MAG: enoyl-ACP reductase [Candidatus Eisenbacteria bacterium]|uniref:Enoyl-[acyl-carrier-protein] reductase [NADH] n=1 Tax=Eiseniibacteriota bacterium TaxID=2212470 RepID=A0A7Y2E5M3_UNCEI|nr:enoyl-ACP reductase [Candidatus Eisenbacteria bacterium]
MYTLDLSGKTAAVFGVANRRSLAYGIAKELGKAGVRQAFTYQGERLKDNVAKLAGDFENSMLLECDVTNESQLESTFSQIKAEFGHLDYLVHSVAFAQKEDLEGDFVNTSRDGFRTALEISAYSLISMTRFAKPLMEGRKGSVVSLSYLGAERSVPHYNVMGTAKAALEQITRQLASELGESGIRVNTISAGPVNTLSARGISGFGKILKVYEERAPLRRNITQEEVGTAALFLLSEMGGGVTGTTLHVDAGYSTVGL